jgi:hypothetical protein
MNIIKHPVWILFWGNQCNSIPNREVFKEILHIIPRVYKEERESGGHPGMY